MMTPLGDTLAVRASGQGLPVIFVHGFPLTNRLWSDQLTCLSDECHAIAPDLPGFGHSSIVSDSGGANPSDHSIARLAQAIEAIRLHLARDEKIVLCGLSMGGYVALEYWSRFSEHLCGLVLAHTKPQADPPAVRDARLAMAKQALEQGASSALDGMASKLLGATSRSHRPEVCEVVLDMMRSIPAQTIASAQTAMANRVDFSKRLGEIAVPTLVVAGEEDTLSTIDETENWAAEIPNADFFAIATAGHLSPIENPGVFNEALGEFLTQLK